jgi:hypothetical protein
MCNISISFHFTFATQPHTPKELKTRKSPRLRLARGLHSSSDSDAVKSGAGWRLARFGNMNSGTDAGKPANQIHIKQCQLFYYPTSLS